MAIIEKIYLLTICLIAACVVIFLIRYRPEIKQQLKRDHSIIPPCPLENPLLPKIVRKVRTMFENERLFWILVTAVIIILAIYCIARANIALDDSSECLDEAAQCMERQSKQIKDYRETVMLQEIKLNEKLAIAADLNLEPLGEFTLTHYSYSGLDIF